MQTQSLVEDIVVKLAEVSVVGLVGWVIHLARRVRQLEENYRASSRETKDRDARVDTALLALGNFSTLMAKVETLLETGLKRLDILEKHIFKF